MWIFLNEISIHCRLSSILYEIINQKHLKYDNRIELLLFLVIFQTLYLLPCYEIKDATQHRTFKVAIYTVI